MGADVSPNKRATVEDQQATQFTAWLRPPQGEGMDAREYLQREFGWTTDNKNIYSQVEAYAAAKVEEIAGGLAEALRRVDSRLEQHGYPPETTMRTEVAAALAAYHEAVGR